MKARTTITSIDDFIKLLKLTPENNRTKLFADYNIVLANLIKNSIDTLVIFWSQLDETLQKDILASHADFLILPFDTLQTFNAALAKHRAFIVKLASDIKAFNTTIGAMFIGPDDVIEMLKKDAELGQKIFGWISFSTTLLGNNKHFLYLLNHAPNVALGVFVKAMDDFFKSPTLELFFLLATNFHLLPKEPANPYTGTGTPAVVRFTTPEKKSMDVQQFFQDSLTTFLKEYKNRDFVGLLLQRDHFLRLNALHSNFSNLVLYVTGRNLIQILFNEKITLDALQALLETHPLLVRRLIETFPDDVAAAFESTVEFCNFFDTLNRCKYYATHRYRTPPLATTQTAKLFADSTVISDWAWLASRSTHSPHETSDLLNKIKENHLPALQQVFSDPQNVQIITANNPSFMARVLGWINTDTLFANPSHYLIFIRNRGQHVDLACFNKKILKQYPGHIKFLYEHTDQFAELEERFVALFPNEIDVGCSDKVNTYVFSHNPDRLLATVKTTDELFNVMRYNIFAEYNLKYPPADNYIKSRACRIPDLLKLSAPPSAAVVRLAKNHAAFFFLLIQHHTDKMLAMLDNSSFMQLSLDMHCSFITYSPQTGRFFSAPYVTLKNVMDILNYFGLHLCNRDKTKQPFFNKMFALYREGFSKIFQSGTLEEKLKVVKFYPDFIKLICDYNLQIMAQAFSGAALVKLLQDNPPGAQFLLDQCKDHVATLIPTPEDLLALQQENHMLMRQFAQQWPDKVPANLAVPPLPSVIRYGHTLWRVPPTLISSEPAITRYSMF